MKELKAGVGNNEVRKLSAVTRTSESDGQRCSHTN